MSEEALVHLKSYKYSSVDKSFISNYILKHYVCAPGNNGLGASVNRGIVEWVRGTTTIMAGAEYGHSTGLLLHLDECHLPGDMDARSGRASQCGESNAEGQCLL